MFVYPMVGRVADYGRTATKVEVVESKRDRRIEKSK